MSFRDDLRAAVGRIGSITEASRRCGVTRQTMHFWLRGDGEPSQATKIGVFVLLKFPAFLRRRRESTLGEALTRAQNESPELRAFLADASKARHGKRWPEKNPRNPPRPEGAR